MLPYKLGQLVTGLFIRLLKQRSNFINMDTKDESNDVISKINLLIGWSIIKLDVQRKLQRMGFYGNKSIAPSVAAYSKFLIWNVG